VLNRPLNYIDPTGHCASDGDDWCQERRQREYWIGFQRGVGGREWTDADKEAVQVAAEAIGRRLAGQLGGTAREAFFEVFGQQFVRTLATSCSTGCWGETTSASSIVIYSNAGELYENMMVHEFAHVFNRRAGRAPANDLEQTQRDDPDFPDRGVYDSAYTGGFASARTRANFRVSFQQSEDGSPNEEFADQFLGWVYDRWEVDSINPDQLSPAGTARRDWMNERIPGYIKLTVNFKE
jgi:hypothetical protein